MAGNAFEDSRVAAGTLSRGGQKPGREGDKQGEESKSISRDDRRDGAAGSVLSSRRMIGARVRNLAAEEPGKVEDIMLDVPTGRIAYAVLSFGGFHGLGDKLFAVPWSVLRLNDAEQEFILDVSRETLEDAPGFDQNHWPDMADPVFGYWEHTVTDAGDYTGESPRLNKSADYEPTSGYQAGGRD